MTRSAPGLDLPSRPAVLDLFEQADAQHYTRVVQQVALPYRIQGGRHVRSEHPSLDINASTGLVASAEDLAFFEGSLDDGRDNIPLSESTLKQMWTQQSVESANGVLPLPTGLGWFVQTASGVPLVWTFGHIPDAGSALIVKMPSKRLTLIMLSNSGGLAAGYNFEQGDVTSSPFVKVFLRLFI
jgi:hypothetical protein